MVLLDYLINTFLFNSPPPPPPSSSSSPTEGAQQQQQSSRYEFGTAVDFVWTARGERIAVTHLRQRRGAAITILYSHANAEDLNQAYPYMHRLAVELNVNVVGYDYSGYGASSGYPSEENCCADIEAVYYEYLLRRNGLSPQQIVLYGRSLGSGPSCHLALQTARASSGATSVGGLILHSAFASIFRVVLDVGFTMMGDKFPNVDWIGQVRCPVLIAHGKCDEVVPWEHGLMLQKTTPKHCRTEPYWMDGTSHNVHPPLVLLKLMRRFHRFLDETVCAKRLYYNRVRLERTYLLTLVRRDPNTKPKEQQQQQEQLAYFESIVTNMEPLECLEEDEEEISLSTPS